MKRLVSLLLTVVLTLSLTSCVKNEISEQKGKVIQLYYPTVLAVSQGGDAITSVEVPWDAFADEVKLIQVEEVMRLLMGGCKDDKFVSPIPHGVTMNSCNVSGAMALVDFSTGYGLLSGMDLTLVDYCVALSLTQIPGIYAARITVNGKEIEYRDTHLFLASDALLTSTEDIVRILPAKLYFTDDQGVLTSEDRYLKLYEGMSRASVILDALFDGPETSNLVSIIPEGFNYLNVRTEKGICYLNLPATGVDLMPVSETEQNILFQMIINSLCSVDTINSVQFLVDGEYAHFYGSVDVSGPISPVNE